MNCACRSYNRPRPYQTVDEVVLTPPFGDKTVCVDACIAPTISHLWGKGVETTGSCCGHNKKRPSVIVAQNNLPASEAARIRLLIADVDDRKWRVLSWTLAEL